MSAAFAPAGRLASRALSLLFWGALALRLWFVLFVHSPRDFVFSDMQSYHAVAIDVLLGRSSPWHAFRPVGYSLLLAVIYAISDGSRTLVGVLQALAGAALVPLTAELAGLCGARRSLQHVCALLVACSVPLVLYCGLLLTEAPSAFLLLFAVTRVLGWLAVPSPLRSRSLWLAGLSLGTAVALRPNLLLLVPLLVLALLDGARSSKRAVEPAREGECAVEARPRARERRREAWRAPLFALAVALPVIGVSAFNSHALGRPVGPAANGGLNFYLNFTDVHTIQYQGPLGGYWVSPVPNGFDHTRRELSAVPFFEDGHYYRLGLRYLAQHPAALGAALDNFVEASGLGRQLYWPNWPGHERLLRGYAHSFFALVLLPALLLLAALGAPRLRRRLPHAALVVAGCCVLGLVPMYLFLGDPRVRVPFDPLWIVLAGLAVELLYRQFARKGAPDDRSPGQEGREPAPPACLRSRAEPHAST